MRISRKSFIKKYKKAKNCNTRTALLKWKKVMLCFGKGSSMNEFGAVNNVGAGQSFIIARNIGNADPFKLSYVKVHNFQRSVTDQLQNPEEYFFIKKYLNGTTRIVEQGNVQQQNVEFNNFVGIPEVIGLFNVHNRNPLTRQQEQLRFFQNHPHPINQDYIVFNNGDTVDDTRVVLNKNLPPRYLLANEVLDHQYLTRVGLAGLSVHLRNTCRIEMNTLAGPGGVVNNIQVKKTYNSCLYTNGNNNLDNKMIKEYFPNPNPPRMAAVGLLNTNFDYENHLNNNRIKECQLFLNFRANGDQKYHFSFKSSHPNTQEILQGNPRHAITTRHPLPPNGVPVNRSSKGYRNAPYFYHFKLEKYNGVDVKNSCYYWYLLFDVVYQRFVFMPSRSVPNTPIIPNFPDNNNPLTINGVQIDLRNDPNVLNFLTCVLNFFNGPYFTRTNPNNPNDYIARKRVQQNGHFYYANDPWGYFTVSPQDINDINNAANVVQLNF